MSTTLQLKRETCAWWASNSPTLADGEPGIETDTGNMKIGNGVSTWNALDYQNAMVSEEAVLPGSATSVNVHGCAIQPAVGTVSHPALATTNAKTRRRRFLVTSSATASSTCEIKLVVLNCWRGNAAGVGGYRYATMFSLDTLQSGMRGYFGLESSVSAIANQDYTTSTTNSKIGMAINANTGNWNILCNAAGTAPTVVDLGSSFPVDNTTVYKLVIVVPPNTAAAYYVVTNVTTGAVVEGSFTTNLPPNTAFMAGKLWLTNNATAAAVALSCMYMRMQPLGAA